MPTTAKNEEKLRQELIRIILALEAYVLNNAQLKPLYNKKNSTFRTALIAHFKDHQDKYANFLQEHGQTIKNYNSIKGDLKRLLRTSFATYFDPTTQPTQNLLP